MKSDDQIMRLLMNMPAIQWEMSKQAGLLSTTGKLSLGLAKRVGSGLSRAGNWAWNGNILGNNKASKVLFGPTKGGNAKWFLGFGAAPAVAAVGAGAAKGGNVGGERPWHL